MGDVKGQVGDTNPNHQKLIAKTAIAGTDHNQRVWRLQCADCGTEYGANGSDFHIRKCPSCQGGRPGLEFT